MPPDPAGPDFAPPADDADGGAALGSVAEVLDSTLEAFAPKVLPLLTSLEDVRYLYEVMPEEMRSWSILRFVNHLQRICRPATTMGEIAEHGWRLGRLHAMTGVATTSYLASASVFERDAVEALRAHPDPELAAAAVGELRSRLNVDLRAVVEGVRRFASAQDAVLLEVTRVTAEAETLTDLARGSLQALARLDGFTVGFFGRPSGDGSFEFEMAAGPSVEQILADRASRPARATGTVTSRIDERGPSGRAWTSGRIERSDSYFTDPTVVSWHATARHYGWQSGAAIPVRDAAGRPKALMALYASVPAFFAPRRRMLFLEQVRTLVEQAMGRIERRTPVPAAVVGFAERAAHLERLGRREVEMVYQPVVSLPDGQVLKFEALARLTDGDRMIAPAAFLPAFGDRELLALFEIGLAQSLDALVEWEAAGLVTGVSINIPAACTSDAACIELVTRNLERRGLDPGRLTVEVLETSVFETDPDQHAAVLAKLQALGVRLSEDDLGSGYSSLLRLRSFSFDEVKIDQELVRGAEHGRHDALRFIQPLTLLSRSMGKRVVVEGLETDGLIEAAIVLGADAGQGYGIARPLRRGDVLGWSREFSLGFDGAAPATATGALAGHLAWEYRVTAWKPLTGAASAIERAGTCPLSRWLADHGDAPPAVLAAHDDLHGLADGDPRAPEHQHAWDRLAIAMSGDPTAGG